MSGVRQEISSRPDPHSRFDKSPFFRYSRGRYRLRQSPITETEENVGQFMMRMNFFVKHLVCFVGLLWLLSFQGCSMQSSKSLNTASNQNQKAGEARGTAKPQEDWLAFKQGVVRIDYLRPVSSIKQPVLYVYKEKRRMYVLDDDVLVREYSIGLGKQTKGDKIKEGDGRTPEGGFTVCMKNGQSRFGRSLALNYPTLKHAQNALFAGLISSDQYREISAAFQQAHIPPWNTALGGEIFVHGGGAHADWTNGCVALYDSDMQELFQIAKLGTPITIRP